MHGIIDVQPNIPFKLLLSNYRNTSYQIPKNQTVEHVLPKLSGIVPTSVKVSDVLGQETTSSIDAD